MLDPTDDGSATYAPRSVSPSNRGQTSTPCGSSRYPCGSTSMACVSFMLVGMKPQWRTFPMGQLSPPTHSSLRRRKARPSTKRSRHFSKARDSNRPALSRQGRLPPRQRTLRLVVTRQHVGRHDRSASQVHPPHRQLMPRPRRRTLATRQPNQTHRTTCVCGSESQQPHIPALIAHR